MVNVDEEEVIQIEKGITTVEPLSEDIDESLYLHLRGDLLELAWD